MRIDTRLDILLLVLYCGGIGYRVVDDPIGRYPIQ
jgi:hypothetical protein